MFPAPPPDTAGATVPAAVLGQVRSAVAHYARLFGQRARELERQAGVTLPVYRVGSVEFCNRRPQYFPDYFMFPANWRRILLLAK